MKTLIAVLVFLTPSFAQDNTPASTIRWDASAPGATKETQPGWIQKNVNSSIAQVSAMAEISPARRFVEPPMEGGYDVTCVVIGIKNTSKQAVHIDPSLITLRIVGKREQEVKRLKENQVIDRAWMEPDRGAGALGGNPVAGEGSATGTSHNTDAALESAVMTREAVGGSRRQREAAAQQTGPQTAKLKERALPGGDLEPGQTVQGLMFFLPYGDKDNVELSVTVADTTFVFPFSGRKAKK